MFYAAFARYGIRSAYGPCHRPAIYVFPTKRERDAWVSADVWDGDFHREPMAGREASKWIRKDCTVFAFNRPESGRGGAGIDLR